MRLDGRVAIVTGAAYGERAAIGSLYAQALAREGAKVTAADIKDCGSVVADITAAGGVAQSVFVDVREENSVAEMVAKRRISLAPLDSLGRRGWSSSAPGPHNGNEVQ